MGCKGNNSYLHIFIGSVEHFPNNMNMEINIINPNRYMNYVCKFLQFTQAYLLELISLEVGLTSIKEIPHISDHHISLSLVCGSIADNMKPVPGPTVDLYIEHSFSVSFAYHKPNFQLIAPNFCHLGMVSTFFASESIT